MLGQAQFQVLQESFQSPVYNEEHVPEKLSKIIQVTRKQTVEKVGWVDIIQWIMIANTSWY